MPAAGGSDLWQVTTRYERASSRVMLRHSPDAGSTWEPDLQVNPEGTNGYDPQVAYADQAGCVFAGWLDDVWRTWVRRSCDGGASWTEPVSIRPDTEWTDHGWLLVSPDGVDVTVGYSGTTWDDADGLGHGHVLASHDGGATFGEPWEAPATDRYGMVSFGARRGDVVYYTAEIYTPDYRGEIELYLWRSVDGGDHFESTRVAVSQEPPDCAWAAGCELGFFASQLAVGADVDNNALVAWHASGTAGQAQSLYVATVAVDAWPVLSAATELSPGGAGGPDHAFPMVAAGPDPGDFRLLYMADESGGGSRWNTWYQQSLDAGATWLDAPVRLSDRADGAFYKSAQGYAFPYGDDNGLAVDDAGRAHAIWGEGAGYDGPGGSWFSDQVDAAAGP